MTARTCWCGAVAVVLLFGKYRNGREAIDPRCYDHMPKDAYGKPLLDQQAAGREAFYGATACVFAIEDIERIIR